MESNNDSKLTY